MGGGFPLTGIDPADPVPGVVRELLFAQGMSSGVGTSRDVLLFGNKTSSGSETAETIGPPISSMENMVERFGERSELALMYRKYVEIDPGATIYAVAITEASAAATVDYTFATDATGPSSVQFTVIGEAVDVFVETGDTPTIIADRAVIKINSQAHWPATATSPSAGVVRLTTANTGLRQRQLLSNSRAAFTKSVATTVSKGTVSTPGASDDNTSALAAAANGTYYYHVGPYDMTGTSVSTTDSAIGEHAYFMLTQSLPTIGKEQLLVVSNTTLSHADADTLGAACNRVRTQYFPCPGNDWSSAMIAAHMAAVIRSKQIAHPAANLTDYGKGPNDVFGIPAPYTKSNIPSTTQVRAHLNNGVSVISWTTSGAPYVVRQITTYCKNGSNYDYRIREGHIVSVVDYMWQWIKARYTSTKQPFVAADPIEGETPKMGITYPSAVTSLVKKLIDDAINFNGGPLLDPSPSSVAAMKASVVTKLLTEGGISCRAQFVTVLHNNKGQFRIEEISDQQ